MVIPFPFFRNKHMKKLAITTILLILIPTLLMAPLYLWMSKSASEHVIDYTQDVIGTWNASQYYAGKELIVCDEEHALGMIIESDTITVTGSETVLENVNEKPYIWKSKVSISYEDSNKTVNLTVSFNARGNLQLKTEDGQYTILLKKAEP